MNKKVITGALIVLLLGTAIGITAIDVLRQPSSPEIKTSSNQSQPLIGSQLPEYNMLALDGVRENSKQWLGKIQVINFWATWCPPCTREIPALIALQNEYRDHGLQVIGIALDNVEAVTQYAQANGMNYPVLVGEDDAIEISVQLGNDMGVLPYTVITDQTGKISYIRYGEVDRETVESEIRKLL